MEPIVVDVTPRSDRDRDLAGVVEDGSVVEDLE